MKLFFFSICCLLGGPLMAADNDPRADLLVEPADLAKAPATFVILDARDRTKYDQGHISNARWVDHATWAKTFDDGKDVEGWSKRIAELGIDGNTRIVVYDDNWNKEAARIWWILRFWSVTDVRLLNGGWKAWTAANLPVQKETPAPPTTTNFVGKSQAERLATKQKLLDFLKENSIQVVDARSMDEFCGLDDNQGKNKRAGAIPGAKHLEWTDLMDKETQRFKSSDEISKLFDEAGIDVKSRTATHCQSGGRASVMAFGLELMGAKDVSNYYRSWSEWGNADDTPVVPGKPKK